MSQTIQLHDKNFELFLSEQKILEAIEKMANEMNQKHTHDTPLFLVVLNGAFMFAAELLKRIDFDCEIEFIRVSSYEKASSTGDVKSILGLTKNIENRIIILLEDIIETGNTITFLYNELNKKGAKEIITSTLFLKPDIYRKPIHIDHIGLEIGNEFIVGFGLDYEGLGRNLSNLFVIKDNIE